MECKLSVIIPVYNVQKYLDECLQNVINQTYRNLEIILVNDGSTDGSYHILRKYEKLDGRIRIINKENGGLSSARNAGIEIATGDYITFVDSDDYPDRSMYEKLMLYMEELDVKIAICSYYRDPKEAGKEIPIRVEKLSREEAFCEIAGCGKIQSHAWTKIYEAKLFSDIRYPEGKLYEDIFTTYRLIEKVDYVAYTNEKLYCYRRNDASITNQCFKQRDMDLVYGSLEFYDFLCRNHYERASGIQRNSVTRNGIALLRKMYVADFYEEELVHFLRNIVAQGYPQYLCSQFKMTSKLFGCFVIFFPKTLYHLVRLRDCYKRNDS